MNLKIVIIISLIAFFIFQTKKKENFTSLDSIVILKSCKNITPSKLITILGGNLHIVKDIFIKNNISPDLVSKPETYPRIASFLVKKGYLVETCDNTI